jgi:type IV pilus assembly protein PilB
VDLTRACYDRHTRWPEGFDPQRHGAVLDQADDAEAEDGLLDQNEPVIGRDFGRFLVDSHLITGSQLERAQKVQRAVRQTDVLRVLADMAFLSEPQALQAMADFRILTSVDLTELSIDPTALEVVPAHIARRHTVLPVHRQGRFLVVATSHPGDILAEDDVRSVSGLKLRWVVTSPDQLRQEIDKHYGSA